MVLRRTFLIVSLYLQSEWTVFTKISPYLIVGAVAASEYNGSTRTLEADVQVPPRSYPIVVEEEVLSPIVFSASRDLDAGSIGTSVVLAFHAPKFLAGALLPHVTVLPI